MTAATEVGRESGQVTAGQYGYLTKGIDPSRVRQLQGNSHLEAWDVRRTLIRVFGFGGFEIESRYETMVREIEIPPGTLKRIDYKTKKETTNDKTLWTVVYRVGLRLTVKDPAGRPIASYDDAATGDAVNQPSLGDAHDLALKTAHSQALKRCAVNLGDQFGLSLYNDGQPNGVVVKSLVSPIVDEPAPTPTDAPPVVGGEIRGAVSDDDGPVIGQVREPLPAEPKGEPTHSPAVVEAAELLAKAASRSNTRTRLLGILSQAKTQKAQHVDVGRSLTDELMAVLGVVERPVTLEAWVTACGKYVANNGGMSVWNAAYPDGGQA